MLLLTLAPPLVPRDVRASWWTESRKGLVDFDFVTVVETYHASAES